MNDEQIVEVIQKAIIRAKAEVFAFDSDQIRMESDLTEPPLSLDSIDFLAMIIELENNFGLIAEDKHFLDPSLRTVADIVSAVKSWLESGAETTE